MDSINKVKTENLQWRYVEPNEMLTEGLWVLEEYEDDKQSKLQSFIEANTNTAVGFCLSVASWHWVIPVLIPQLEPHSGWDTAIGVTFFFTVLSVARNYVIRRIFNRG